MPIREGGSISGLVFGDGERRELRTGRGGGSKVAFVGYERTKIRNLIYQKKFVF